MYVYIYSCMNVIVQDLLGNIGYRRSIYKLCVCVCSHTRANSASARLNAKARPHSYVIHVNNSLSGIELVTYSDILIIVYLRCS